MTRTFGQAMRSSVGTIAPCSRRRVRGLIASAARGCRRGAARRPATRAAAWLVAAPASTSRARVARGARVAAGPGDMSRAPQRRPVGDRPGSDRRLAGLASTIRRSRLRARNAGCRTPSARAAPAGSRGRARSGRIRRAAGARCSGGARAGPPRPAPPAGASACSARCRGFRGTRRSASCRANASRRIRMLHHSPTRSRLRAIGQCMSAKLLRCMVGMVRQ